MGKDKNMKRLSVAALLAALIMTGHAMSVFAEEYIAVIYQDNNQANALEIQEGPPINEVAEALDEADENRPVYADIHFTEEEGRLLRSILALEADFKTEGFIGQCGVVEVIFNRMRSHEWPDTLSGVIYQKGQFATVKSLKKPYNLPGEPEDDAISAVLRETETVLPSTDYVYFSRKKRNGKAFIKINNHWFSR